MIAFFLGQALGLGGIALIFTILEGLTLSVAIAVLAERYLFPIRD